MNMTSPPSSQDRHTEGGERKPDTLRPSGKFAAPPPAQTEQEAPRSRRSRRGASQTLEGYEREATQVPPPPPDAVEHLPSVQRAASDDLVDAVSRVPGVLGCAEVLLDHEAVISHRASRDDIDVVGAALACTQTLDTQSSLLARAGASSRPRELLISKQGYALVVMAHPRVEGRLLFSALEGHDSEINLALHKLRTLLESHP